MKSIPIWMDHWYRSSLDQIKYVDDSEKITFSSINNELIYYDDLKLSRDIPKVALLKLNGGLGTSMGCNGPKSLIKFNDSNSFLDLIVHQYQHCNVSTRLLLLNSFNTSVDTKSFLSSNYPTLEWQEVMQYPFKKINQNTMRPYDADDSFFFNPPGHGSVYFDLYYSGILHELLSNDIEYVFISNADNLAATCDPLIASYLKTSQSPFLIELTHKAPMDLKGGTVVSSNGQLKLLESAQVNDSHRSLFESQPFFNTNNIWVHVPTLISIIESNNLRMDLILNRKNKNGHSFIQLEYAMGSAIQSFDQPKVLIVNRDRFFPVKKTSDLLLLSSDYVSLSQNGLTWDVNRMVDIQCSFPFDSVDAFYRYCRVIPSLKDIRSLYLKGKIYFNHFVTLKGHVEIIVDDDDELVIGPDLEELNNVRFEAGKFIPF